MLRKLSRLLLSLSFLFLSLQGVAMESDQDELCGSEGCETSYIDQAYDYYHKGLFDQSNYFALMALQQPNINNSHGKSFLIRSVIAYKARHPALCVKLAKKVLEYPDTDRTHGTHGKAWVNMASGLARLGRFEESLKAANTALKFPNIGNIHLGAWESKSVSLAHLRQFEQCRVAAENAIRHENGGISFLGKLYKVICLYGEGAFDQCVDEADAFDGELLAASSVYDTLQLYKGYCFYEKGMWREARERAQWFLNRQTDDDAVIDAKQLKRLSESFWYIYPFTTSFSPRL